MFPWNVLMGLVLTVAAHGWEPHNILANRSPTPHPIYESVGPEEKRSRVLIEENVLHFGGEESSAKSLIKSDIGYPLYFQAVAGGVRAQGKPLLFPDGVRTRYELDDYTCSIAYEGSSAAVSCVGKGDDRAVTSLLASGKLIEFEDRCFYLPERFCRYRLISGQGLTPSKVPPAP